MAKKIDLVDKKGFRVIMKKGTSSKEVAKLIEKIFENKFVEKIEGAIRLGL